MKLMDSLKEQVRPVLGNHPWLFLVMIVIAIVIRLPGIQQWPMPFHPMLQYENALYAKYFYLHKNPDIQSEHDKTWMEGFQGRTKGFPFFLNQITSDEAPWIGTVSTCFNWIVSAFTLHYLALRLSHSSYGAFVVVGFFLFHPFTVVVSRSLQHEAGMMFGLLIGWAFLSWRDSMHSWRSSLQVGMVGGIVLCMKAGAALIPLAAVHLGYCVTRHGWRTTLFSPRFYVTALLLFLPSYLWVKYILGMNETHQLKWFLLLDSNWYITTWQHMTKVIGLVPLLVFLGVTVWKVCQRDWFWICAFAGCVAYVVFFNYACMTHDYYLLPLFPMIALAWGKLAQWLIWRCKQLTPQPGEAGTREHGFWQYRRVLPYIVSIMLIAITSSFGSTSVNMLTSGPYRPLEATCKQLGEHLGIGTKVIALTNDYAMPLRYFSGLHAEWWPTAGDLWYEGLAGGTVKSASERLGQLQERTKARYFIVTLHDELAQQADLQKLLQQYVELPSTIEGVRIFDLSQRR